MVLEIRTSSELNISYTCRHKPKEKCLTYMKMLRERNETSSNDVEDWSTPVTSSEGSNSEPEGTCVYKMRLKVYLYMKAEPEGTCALS